MFWFTVWKGLRFAAKVCGVSIIPSGESMEGALRQIMPHVCFYCFTSFLFLGSHRKDPYLFDSSSSRRRIF
jgi:hypothetical protein